MGFALTSKRNNSENGHIFHNCEVHASERGHSLNRVPSCNELLVPHLDATRSSLRYFGPTWSITRTIRERESTYLCTYVRIRWKKNGSAPTWIRSFVLYARGECLLTKRLTSNLDLEGVILILKQCIFDRSLFSAGRATKARTSLISNVSNPMRFDKRDRYLGVGGRFQVRV